jgi:hypothetical protein
MLYSIQPNSTSTTAEALTQTTKPLKAIGRLLLDMKKSKA